MKIIFRNISLLFHYSSVLFIKLFNTLPTYLGFGNMWRDPIFTERAAMFFDIAKKTTDIFNVDLCDNAFFHPLYLMRYAKNRPECKCLVDDFRKCIKYDMVKTQTLF